MHSKQVLLRYCVRHYDNIDQYHDAGDTSSPNNTTKN